MTPKVMKALSMKEKRALYLKAKDFYYNDETGNSGPLNDAQFDALEELIRAETPEWSGLKKTGIKVGKKTDVKLDVPMPSLDKVVAGRNDGLGKFLAKYPDTNFMIPEKLDGGSIQATWLQGKLKKLATRGDGVTGKDISYFIPHVNLPQTLNTAAAKIVLRLEAVIPIKVFAKKWADKFDSARALASGILNKQEVHEALKDLHFVVLRQMYPNISLSTMYEQFYDGGDFELPRVIRLHASKITEELLSKKLEAWRATARYETDGLVLWPDKSALETTGDRPKYAKAFKVNDEANAQVTTVTNIVWQPSRYGTLVPKVSIAPLKFGGVTVRQAALYNPKWGYAHGVGVGALVKVIRSGDIIPKIVGVVKKTKLILPTVDEFGLYEWDKTQTQLQLVNAQANDTVLARQFTNFFVKLGLDDMAIGLAHKLVGASYTKTWQLTSMHEKDFAKLPGVKTSATKYAAQIQRVRDGEFGIVKLMLASGVFDKGVGETMLTTLDKDVGLSDLTPRDVLSEGYIADLKDCGTVFAGKFMRGLPKFQKWLDRSAANVAAPLKAKAAVKGPLTGMTFSWTGYRSKDEEAQITALGGTVDKLSAKTDVLFFDADGKFMEKVEKAEARGVAVDSNFTKYLKLWSKGATSMRSISSAMKALRK